MYAVIKTGGKQYRVAPADVIDVERLAGEAGESVAFADVLMVGGDDGVTVGEPMVAGATVAGEIVGQSRGPRILVFKKRRRKNSKRSRGHRQLFTKVRITEILTDGKAPSTARKKAAAPARAEAGIAPQQVEAEAAPDTPPAPPTAEPQAAPPAEAAPAKAEAGGDNLKKLSGVGPAIEKKLHGLGVTTFAEIAGWTAEDIARVDEALNFKGRIERDDWIGQAKKLAAEDK